IGHDIGGNVRNSCTAIGCFDISKSSGKHSAAACRQLHLNQAFAEPAAFQNAATPPESPLDDVFHNGQVRAWTVCFHEWLQRNIHGVCIRKQCMEVLHQTI